MKKLILLCGAFAVLAMSAFAQSDDDLFGGSSDDSFFSDDDLFGDDSMFGDDTIVEVSDVSSKSDLSKGVIFNSGSIKVGGSVSASLSSNTLLYAPDDETTFGNKVYNTKLTPDLSGMLTVDARPTETLRMYTKFGFAYPFVNSVSGYTNVTYSSVGKGADISIIPTVSDVKFLGFDENMNPIMGSPANITSTEWFKLKELFTDFSYKDTAFFRFGIHTVTWGAGYFFSPVSDMINTSSIDPEHPENQVDGALNLRTQIIFPGTQNCLWFYVIPSSDFTNQSSEDYARNTALAGKADILLGGWEFGLGGFYKYHTAPKAMLTATGSLRKMSFFGEFVYSYGAASEWATNTDWDDKSNIIQATAGFSYYWKDPKINLAAQYYFEGNDVDFEKKYIQYGHNIGLMASKGDLFKNSDLSLSLFAMANFGRKELDVDIEQMRTSLMMFPAITESDVNSALSSIEAIKNYPDLIAKVTLGYTPFKDLKITAGPSLTFPKIDKKPTVSFSLTATLGGGKF